MDTTFDVLILAVLGAMIWLVGTLLLWRSLRRQEDLIDALRWLHTRQAQEEREIPPDRRLPDLADTWAAHFPTDRR
jgi:hypothetical protein